MYLYIYLFKGRLNVEKCKRAMTRYAKLDMIAQSHAYGITELCQARDGELDIGLHNDDIHALVKAVYCSLGRMSHTTHSKYVYDIL